MSGDTDSLFYSRKVGWIERLTVCELLVVYNNFTEFKEKTPNSSREKKKMKERG